MAIQKVPVTCHDCGSPRKAHPQWLATMIREFGFYVCFDCGIVRQQHIKVIHVHLGGA